MSRFVELASGTGTGTPTGITYSGSNDFASVTGAPPSPGAPASMAPARFIFAGEDGLISAWAPGPTTAVRAATNPDLRASRRRTVGIAFGNGVQQQPTDTLFFAAGPDDENHGVDGRIDAQAGNGDGQGND